MSTHSPSTLPGPPSASRPAQVTVRKAARSTDNVVIGGVAAGLAEHLAVPVIWVRACFVLGALLGGAGIAMYAGLWLLLPSAARGLEQPPGLAGAGRAGKRPRPPRRLADVGPAVALAALALGLLLGVQSVLGANTVFWAAALAVGGVALLWRQADEAQRERWLDTSGRIDPVRAVFGRGGWASYTRVAVGAGLVLGAVGVFTVRSGGVQVARDVLSATLLGIAGLAIVIGPWMYRLATDLTSERAERVRSQARADMAAHLHDSVLQTLALIQKNAGDSGTVAKLARAQERDLRSWLFDDPLPPGGTLVSALREAAADADEAHGVAVDVVSVGDAPLTEELRPLVLAAREAVANAARHAGTARVDVYAEVGPERVEVFVRDRGVGFEMAAVAADRRGIRGSIVDRMARHGGTSEVRSVPGEGTEVRLGMPRRKGS